MKSMKTGIALIAAFFLTMMMSSCGKEICVKCVKYDYSDSVDFCSVEKSERNNFQVEWNDKGYNCMQEADE